MLHDLDDLRQVGPRRREQHGRASSAPLQLRPAGVRVVLEKAASSQLLLYLIRSLGASRVGSGARHDLDRRRPSRHPARKLLEPSASAAGLLNPKIAITLLKQPQRPGRSSAGSPARELARLQHGAAVRVERREQLFDALTGGGARAHDRRRPARAAAGVDSRERGTELGSGALCDRPRSALLITNTSGTSMMPAFKNCSMSPDAG